MTTTSPPATALFAAPSIAIVTPDVARTMLEQHPRNRVLSTKRVGLLAHAMREGRWLFDGSPIRFDETGSLVDGQHRLHAVIESNIPCQFLIVRGVPVEAMTTMDTGKPRSFSDMLKIEDGSLTQVTSLAATVRVTRLWAVGFRGKSLYNVSGSTPAVSAATSAPLLMQWFRENRDTLVDLSARARQIGNLVPGMTSNAISCVLWALKDSDVAEVDFFFGRVIDGVELSATSPVLALRRRLASASKPTGGRPANLPLDEAVALTIKAWNLFCAGDTVNVLGWRAGGAYPEAFPEPTVISKEN